ncbi:hypothetical protein OPV22_001399 [Ensete ventricosum]|uniref:Methionyl/Leucyl tRNA synthetase domain-containing protein n=1 Tax=Ensete ventricosum TaxID=4639 RepID=A0AAV8QDQ4_ENSVE|nr:hypothetical protein OPV22_001399 [Ensete ventricosum]
MYEQTNAWVLPDGKYGAFEINETDVSIITYRAALNHAYQKLSLSPEKPTDLLELSGHDPFRSPLAFNEIIYSLPMLTILTDKDERVLPFEVIPIINIPEFGDKSAEKVCVDLRIRSQNDKEKLAEVKKLTNLKGFTDGAMLVGGFKGTKVQEAKPLIRNKLLVTGDAVMYSEPKRKSCLDQCACSRSFGLGTHLPWDEQFLVESLSDSTLYMAFYTIAHILQGDDMSTKSDIPVLLLNKMKQEFNYWYPFDLHVSGKDLIQNHLTFCIYNLTALLPEHHLPRGFRCNGHLTLNSEKISKSTGNFRTIRQAMEEFSSNATRFSLADAGDGMDDANFVLKQQMLQY